MTVEQLTKISSYGGKVRAFLWDVISTHINNGGSTNITGESLVALMEKHWGRKIEELESSYIKRNLAEMAASANVPIVRVEGSRSGKYVVLKAITAEALKARKEGQPKSGKGPYSKTVSPMVLEPPPPPDIRAGVMLEVLDVRGTTAIVRTSERVFRIEFEPLLA